MHRCARVTYETPLARNCAYYTNTRLPRRLRPHRAEAVSTGELSSLLVAPREKRRGCFFFLSKSGECAARAHIFDRHASRDIATRRLIVEDSLYSLLGPQGGDPSAAAAAKVRDRVHLAGYAGQRGRLPADHRRLHVRQRWRRQRWRRWRRRRRAAARLLARRVQAQAQLQEMVGVDAAVGRAVLLRRRPHDDAREPRLRGERLLENERRRCAAGIQP